MGQGEGMEEIMKETRGQQIWGALQALGMFTLVAPVVALAICLPLWAVKMAVEWLLGLRH